MSFSSSSRDVVIGTAPERAARPAGAVARIWQLSALLHLLLVFPAWAQLTTVEYRVGGTALITSPAAVAVPKGIAGSVRVDLAGVDLTQEPVRSSYVEAVLRGPGLPEPRRLVGAVNEALLFPPLNLVGDYQLSNIRLVNGVTGETVMEATPGTVPVRVFDEILVSRVTSRPLTLEEIQEKGIFIDESNFRAVEFEAAFVLDGQTIPIRFPVISPKFKESTEIIPAAELEARLAEAAVLNAKISSEVVQLPPEFQTASLNIEIQGINFQAVDPAEDAPLALRIPPIPALMVIPGNIGYLHQFFSVQIFTENAAPAGSGLSVRNVKATLKLPPGPDRVAATEYASPGDDPLRFARVGPQKVIQPEQTIVQPGPDGKAGTADDVGLLGAGDSGQAEFLVEGLQEGLHVMDLDLVADLDGLAAGTVRVKGKAAGAVLVRNPKFSMAFAHPRTVRAGEPYEASVTLLNTGSTPANLVQVSLNRNSISGARLEDETQQTVQLGTILPGQTATARFRMRSLRTGSVSFSNLTTSDDSIEGRFRLSMGVDERGVALSPDTIAMPDFVTALPEALQFAATRVLGQALSVATAAQLPPGVRGIPKGIVTRRVLELAEAGQRLRYNDPLPRVLADLLLDWQGGREANLGFDQILRETEAGLEWRQAIFNALLKSENLDATASLVSHSPDLAGLGQPWVLGSASVGSHWLALASSTNQVNPARSEVPYHLVYQGSNGLWSAGVPSTNYPVILHWSPTSSVSRLELAATVLSGDGTGRQLRWDISNPPANAVYRFGPDFSGTELQVDLNNDGTFESSLAGIVSPVVEVPPSVIAVEQDVSILAGRPFAPCIGPQNIFNYGTVLAVVYSKPMTQATAGNESAYTVDGGNGANSAQIQPGGRVVYLNLRKGVSAIRQRTLSFQGITDSRGNALVTPSRPIRSVEPGTTAPFIDGVAIKGRALRGNGQLAAGIPVTLTMYDQAFSGLFCESWTRRVSQVITDEKGAFEFDFVLAGIPYSISATDTGELSAEALAIIAEATTQTAVDSQRIEELATSEATRDTLLGAFAAGSLPQAIAKVEGLDRALVRDFIAPDSGRIGQEVPVALRFRGRAIVTGQVLAADGVSPIPGAAVNLFPDLDSRELGRGILADEQGLFAFYGVPLGVFSVEVATSDRRTRTVSGLVSVPDQVTNLVISLPSQITPYAQFRGRVFDSDNLTPQAGARVFLGTLELNSVKDVVRIATTDSDGNWEAKDVPLRSLDVVAVSFDGKRKGVRAGVVPQADVLTVVNVALEATTRVFGRVQFEDGRPAPNALVAGGESLVRTDTNGYFTLAGVPLGSRSFSAGIERNLAAGIEFPRLGTTTMTIVPGVDNFVVIKFSSAGRIFGKVLDVNGAPKGGVRIAIPIEGGFLWTDADSQGNYVFENLGLGSYTLSAPANAVFNNTLDVRALNEKIRSGNEEEIMAAFEEAISVFVGANDPLLTGAQLNFRPSSWGYTRTRLRFDGESVEANIRYIAEGSVTGQVVNHQGVPIGARVRLNGIGPAINGEPKMTIRGELDSDPATGLFIFPGNLLAGPWTLQVASPFYPVILSKEGFTTELDPNVTNVVMKFPPIREVNGRIAGRVLRPDGSLVGEGVKVRISISNDYEIQTDTNGVFDTQIAVPAGGYRVTAFDAESGLRGEAYLGVTAGITNFVDVSLLTKNSAVKVVVVRGNGLPAPGAQVDLEQGSFPRDPRITLIANEQGEVTFTDLWEGTYAVCAQYLDGATRLYARGGASVGPNSTTPVTLRLGATGTLVGQFVKRDLVTPVAGAQVAIGNLGFASTDDEGRFRFTGVPIGTYRLTTSDPVSGAAAQASVTLTLPDQEQTVLIVEGARGEVTGFVADSYGQGYVPGATVTIRFSDGVTASRSVTTGPDGRFSFPGSPVGAFHLTARDLDKVKGGRGVSGQASGVLSEPSLLASVDIQLQQLGVLPVQVLREDGLTPAENVRVTLSGRPSQDTGPSGEVLFIDLPYRSSVTAVAISSRAGNQHSGSSGSVAINQIGTNPPLVLRLRGVGNVSGQVVGSDGSTPVVGAEVVIQYLAPLFSGEKRLAISGAQGGFTFDDVPLGPYRVTAQNVSLAGSVSGDISQHEESDSVRIRLGDSGRIRGRLVRADGETPVEGVNLAVLYNSQSTNPGRAAALTDANGAFEFLNVPLGSFHLTAAAPAFGGVVELDRQLISNGQDLELGDLAFDEEFPRVLSVTPAYGSVGVNTTNAVEIVFSEALIPASVNPQGVYLRSGSAKVDASLVLLDDEVGIPRIVRLTPLRPLLSERVYEIVVVAGEVFGAGGQATGSGPLDLVKRPLTSPVLSRFTTDDNDPPVLLSLFPTNGAIQIDPRSLPRLSFNEALRSTGFVFRLTGPSGEVPGTASVGLNGQVLSFLPNADLRPNARYSLIASNLLDLAGNLSTNEPYVATFDTLDTVGPRLKTVAIADGRRPAANATVPIEVSLETDEPGVSVRLSQDFTALGTTTNKPYRFNVKLPGSGATTLRAIATDIFGNEGPLGELVVQVDVNQRPTVTFVRVLPLDGPAASGSTVIVDVVASDDSGISQLKAIVGGLPGTSLLTTNGSLVRIQGIIPSTSGPGTIEFFAEATDDIGQSSGQQTLSIPIRDATLPTMALVSPAAGSVLNPGTVTPLSLQLADNFGVTEVTLEVAGAFSLSSTTTISPAQTNGSYQLDLPVPSTAPVNAESVQVTLTARDAAGNVSAQVVRSFRMPDRTAPTLLSSTPSPGATGIDVGIVVSLLFSEPLDSNTVTTNSITLSKADDGALVPAVVQLAPDLKSVTVDPVAPLAAETLYRLVVAATVKDLANNSLVASITNDFRTSEFQLASPLPGQSVVEGQALVLRAGSATLIFSKVRFLADGSEVSVVTASPYTNLFPVPSIASLGTNRITIGAEALSASDVKLASAFATITIYAANEDTDGDGVSNADELAQGMDPFTPNVPPTIQAPFVVEVVQGVLTNVLVGAVDPDGNLLRLQVRESLADDRVRLFETLYFAPSGGLDFQSPLPTGSFSGPVLIRSSVPGSLSFLVRALDGGGLSATQAVTVVTLQDRDLDGIADRDDQDRDGDGFTNAQETTLGLNPDESDTDGDGIPDAVETSGSNGFVTNALHADTDADGVPDGFELALGTNPTNSNDGSSIVVINGRTVTFDGSARLGTLVLTNGAVLTHPIAGLSGAPRLELSVTRLVVDATSRIDLTGRGYLGGLRAPNNASQSGRTFGNTTIGGSTRRNGGSHAGLGGMGDTEPTPAQPYGSFKTPQTLGGGGGSDVTAAGNGGGRVQITAESIELEGQILADGEDGSRYAGGGAGGSVYIRTGNLLGAGAIRANGGGSGPQSGGGGGGRIALYFTNAASVVFTNVQASGGDLTARSEGTPGTVYVEQASHLSELVVARTSTNNLAEATPLGSLAGGISAVLQANLLGDRAAAFVPGALIGMQLKPNPTSTRLFRIVGNSRSYIFTDPADGNLTDVARVGDAYSAELSVGRLIIRQGATVEIADANLERPDRRGRLVATELELSVGARLTHPYATIATQFGLELDIANSLKVDATSQINVSDRGYLGGLSRDNSFSSFGRTMGNTTQGGSFRRSGGSYGGIGATGDAEQFVNEVYGSYSDPSEVGSGGGSDSSPAGNGGGLIRIQVDYLSLDGQLLANGGSGSRYAGGGSGGGIKISANSLSGSGLVTANGGDGGLQSGGGGGGRIAIFYNTSTNFSFESLSAAGGGGRSEGGTGGVGTVVARQAGNIPTIVIRSTGRETPLPEFQGEHLVVDGAVVSGKALNLASLTLTNGAVLTHPAATADTESRLEINVGQLIISADSRIDVTGRGYLGALKGANANSASGRTLGNTTTGGSTRRNGGSYGGLGATGDAEQTVNGIYGSFYDPNESGSGGGSDSGAAGNGGGVVRITAQTMSFEGLIRANGGSGSRYAGGGSGGAIKITTDTISGSGLVQVNGGDGGPQSGGGGGGRVAVYYQSAVNFDLLQLESKGGSGQDHGAPGTVVTKRGAAIAQVLIRGEGRETPLPPTLQGDHVIVEGSRVSGNLVTLSSLLLTNGAVLTHDGTGAASESRLELQVTDLIISSDSRIDVSGRGYLGGLNGANAGSSSGRTLGNTVVGGSTRRNGGGYGGLGATGDTEQSVNVTYGSFYDPNELGSGGGSDSGAAGSGGGLVRITATNLSLEGQIRANGNIGSRYAGGGSGGGIKITTTSISGSGSIQVNGGDGGPQSGGGGGGRIAVYYQTAANFGLLKLESLGGSGRDVGAPGTIVTKRGTAIADVVIRGSGRETPLPPTLLGDHLIVDGAIVSADGVTLSSLILTNGAVLTHAFTDLTTEGRLEINATTLLIDGDSRIDVSRRGYLGGLRGLNGGSQSGRTFGNTTSGGSTRRNGGSYGGMGAMGNTESTTASVYGAFHSPNEVGSGGGSDSGPAGSGGGLVHLNIDSLVLEGQILADGEGGSRYAGGGSGGAILIRARSLVGSGLISANGGFSGPESGGGGGGRIAIYSDSVAQAVVDLVQALGGPGGLRSGSPGTIYFQSAVAPTGHLVIDSRGANAPSRATPLLSVGGSTSTALSATLLTDTNANLPPGGLVGLLLKPNAAQAASFLIVSNTATTIVTDPLDGNMTPAAVVGNAYSVTPTVGKLSVRGGAIVELVDADTSLSDRRGTFRATTAEIVGSSLLTHPSNTGDVQFGLELVVDEVLTVDATSRVDVSQLGYLGASKPGNFSQSGKTFGNDSLLGSTRRNGGSHGGSGGFGNTGGIVGELYDDQQAPTQPGGGGGSDSGGAGNGGGVVRLYVGTLQLQGKIAADGESGSRYAAGGAGGSIWINVRTLSGTGSMSADGGNGAQESGGGGGGRIAIYYQDASAFDFLKVTTLGGAGLSSGADGTRYYLPTQFVPPSAPAVPRLQAVIYEIAVSGISDPSTPSTAGGSGDAEVLVRWTGEPGRRFAVESTRDLIHWTTIPVVVVETSSGRYQARIADSGAPLQQGFFRVRKLD
ncbi:MAG: carboxypeptidase regulatory-like domain-containing protein [Verrucomicrobiales bacterium]|nr:carboxypeptidase regulatory-like domain-containing protein [Verrucomicrobiales bacterium]